MQLIKPNRPTHDIQGLLPDAALEGIDHAGLWLGLGVLSFGSL